MRGRGPETVKHLHRDTEKGFRDIKIRIWTDKGKVIQGERIMDRETDKMRYR